MPSEVAAGRAQSQMTRYWKYCKKLQLTFLNFVKLPLTIWKFHITVCEDRCMRVNFTQSSEEEFRDSCFFKKCNYSSMFHVL